MTPGGTHEAPAPALAAGGAEAAALSPRTRSALRDRRSQEAKVAAAFLAAAKRKQTVDTIDAPPRDPAVPNTQHQSEAAPGDAALPGAGRPIMTDTPSRRRMSPHDPVRSSERPSAKGPVPDTAGREHDWWASARAKTPRADREAAILKEREARRHPSADRYHSIGRVEHAPSRQNVVTGRVLGTCTEATAALPPGSGTPRSSRRRGTPPQPLGRQGGDSPAHQRVRARGRSPGSEKNRSSAGAAAALTWNPEAFQRPSTPTDPRRSSHTCDRPSQHPVAAPPKQDHDGDASVRSGRSCTDSRAASTATARSRATSLSLGASRPPALGTSRDRVLEWTRSAGSPFAASDGHAQQRQSHGRRSFPQHQSTKDNLRWW